MDGLHLLADLYLCEPAPVSLMTDPHDLRELCVRLVASAHLSQVAQLFHRFDAPPTKPSGTASQASGITGIVLLAESHLAIHTWPEKNSVTLDIYVCNYEQNNSAKARALLEGLVQAFKPSAQQVQEVVRGVPF